MKKVIVLLFFVMVAISAMCQSYMGRTVKEVDFRETAGDATPVIKTLVAGTAVCIISLSPDKHYYNVIEIASGEEGYVHKDFVRVGKRVRGGDKGILKATGGIISVNPEVVVINNTDKLLKLRLNDESISVSPKSQKTINAKPGRFSYRAFSPGSIPIAGKGKLKSNQRYTWEFEFVRTYEKDEKY